MKALVKAEFLKLITTRMTYGLVAGVAAVTLVTVLLGVLRSGQNGVPSLGTFTHLRRVISNSGGVGTIFALLFGVTAVAGEFRHKTAASTFLASPRRFRVIVAKMIAYPVAGILVGAAAVGMSLAVAGLALSAAAVDLGSILNGPIALVAGSWVLSAGLYCLIGIGLGGVMRNQLAAMIVALAWPQVIENIIHDLTWLYRWAPGGANSALVRAEQAGLLSPWQGALLLALYGLALGLLACVATNCRDIP